MFSDFIPTFLFFLNIFLYFCKYYYEIMSGNEPKNLIKTSYSIVEAIEYMKMKDKQPTKTSVSWFNVKTGKKIVIGYTS